MAENTSSQRPARPPVVETVLGVQFVPLAEFSNAHLGVFWKTLDHGWSRVNDAPALEHSYEKFGADKSWGAPPQIRFLASPLPLSRLQIRNEDGDRMIQVQNGRLHYNWLGHEGGEYPRYIRIRPEFDKTFDSFRTFVQESSLGELTPDHWEITYVNHIPKGAIWETKEDWSDILPGCIPPVRLSNVGLESLSGRWHYEIRPQKGRLHVELSHSRRGERELLRLELTARGPINPENSLSRGLDIGYDAIVSAFEDLASQKAKDYWGL